MEGIVFCQFPVFVDEKLVILKVKEVDTLIMIELHHLIQDLMERLQTTPRLRTQDIFIQNRLVVIEQDTTYVVHQDIIFMML